MHSLKRRAVNLAILALGAILPAAAARISTVTASTTMGSGIATNLVNTVNGVGLDALTLTANHASTIPTDSWVSATGTLIGNVDFNLGGAFLVTSLSFWNQNDGGPGAAGVTGIRGVDIFYSSDNGANYNLWAGDVAQFNQVTLSGPVGPQILSAAAVSATNFRFVVLSNWGDTDQTGFAEVAFDGSNVPEPATWGIVGLSLLALVIRRSDNKV